MTSVRTQEVGLGGIAVPPERLRTLNPAVVDELAASIKEEGLIHPILLRPRSRDGIGYLLVAGRHRFEAVRKLGWASIRAEIREGLQAVEAELAEIDENLVRAELSSAERDLHLSRRKVLYENKHGSPKAKGAHAANRKMGNAHDATAESADAFTSDAAKKTGKSERTIQKSTARAEVLGDDNLRHIVGTSLDKPEQLNALAKLDRATREEVINRALAGERVNAGTEVKKQQRAEREAVLAARIVALPDIKFGVIVEDLEWHHRTWSEKGMDRHAANHYPTAQNATTAAELHEYSKDRFACAADDCVLWMWATVPLLDVAIDLMRLRGFRYVSNYVWAKDKAGTGYWNHNKHEHLLIGTKGNIPCPAPGTQWDSVVAAPVGEHSAKPESFLAMIEAYYPNVPKLELNHRGPPRPGWTGWGNEAEPAPGDSQSEAAE